MARVEAAEQASQEPKALSVTTGSDALEDGGTGENQDRARAVAALPDGPEGLPVPVSISYEIIQLFSEGLYQSPQKAIEELVTNGFDAGAHVVRVTLPSAEDKVTLKRESLFVFDDGTGMDLDGFKALWAVAHSTKKGAESLNDRKPIGQFGIGKLAAFVLAWQLTHVSLVDGQIRAISMNFHRVTGVHQWDPGATPVELHVHDLTIEQAKAILGELELRDAVTWAHLFGAEAKAHWTVAILSDFKDLFEKLSTKRLKWVLRTGLPLVTNFSVYVDGDEMKSSKLDTDPLFVSAIGGSNDTAATKVGLVATPSGVQIAGISGEIRGSASLYRQPLSKGKAEGTGRSHGFFIRVRERIINLEDELFGLSALSHGAWSRFAMVVEADGLHEHLLSSREGIKDSRAIRTLRSYLHEKFNVCRTRWILEEEADIKRLSLSTIRGDADGQPLSAPIIDAVSRSVQRSSASSYYLQLPSDLDAEARDAFAQEFAEGANEQPFKSAEPAENGAYAPMVRYAAKERTLNWNVDHPLMAYIRRFSKNDNPVEILAAAEVLAESILIAEGVSAELVDYVLRQRDRAIRVLVGEKPPIASTVIDELDLAPEDKDALEKAVGRAFQVLGFEYTAAGGNTGGTDGLLSARLGAQAEGLADFKIVYDAKTTESVSVSVGKVDWTALLDFATENAASCAFFVAKKFDGQANELAAINRRRDLLNDLGLGQFRLVLLTVDHLKSLVRLHLHYGVTLTMVKDLFQNCGSTDEVTSWIAGLGEKLRGNRVPLEHLFGRLEAAKADVGEKINIRSVRVLDERLKQFPNEKLLSQVSAVESLLGPTWLSVDEVTMDVFMHSSADQLVAEMHRLLEVNGIALDS